MRIATDINRLPGFLERYVQVGVALTKSGKPGVTLTSAEILEDVDVPTLVERHKEAKRRQEACNTMSTSDNGTAGIALAIEIVGMGASVQEATDGLLVEGRILVALRSKRYRIPPSFDWHPFVEISEIVRLATGQIETFGAGDGGNIDAVNRRLDDAYPNARSKQIVEFEGSRYERWFKPAKIDRKTKKVTSWNKGWSQISPSS